MNLLTDLKKQYSGKKVLVVGLGLQGGGVGIAQFFSNLDATVTITDKKAETQLLQSVNKLKQYNIRYSLGHHDPKDFLEADIIIKAPKMRWDDPLIADALKKGIEVEMETALFASYCPAPIIGITGTRGKSTTTMMIYELLQKHSGRRVHLAGNLPDRPSLNLLFEIQSEDLVVLELSSWQLSGFHRKKISPHIAVFTNFYPDHYDYYANEQEYLYDKKAIYLYQKPGDYLIANKSLATIIENDRPRSNVTFFGSIDLVELQYLKGLHNRENAAAVLEVAKIFGLDALQSATIVKSFRGLPYRQEVILEKDGVIFINDTTSTTPVATIKALETFQEDPVVLILGGNSKNLPTEVLMDRLIDTDKIVLLKGSFTDEILPELKKRYLPKLTKQYDHLEEAVRKAYQEAKNLRAKSRRRKTVVLFSPGATSFAMFHNEFHRGDEFNKVVRDIQKDVR